MTGVKRPPRPRDRRVNDAHVKLGMSSQGSVVNGRWVARNERRNPSESRSVPRKEPKCSYRSAPHQFLMPTL
ncbi:unnamed protein product [Danaus chrysippus]|uniref:(African queen) hypothetical protein n=1 Tax=Danaus chrysippus TaxID=151541 RepID=A0A8J2QU94_9NEOP|nr:unnamed protein product [Danaus chrysippus]